jgi:SAM-dependent methyltransferase
MNRYVQIDEEGYFVSGGNRVTDTEYGAELLKSLYVEERAYKTHHDGQVFTVEAFDDPFVAIGVERGPGQQVTHEPEALLQIQLPYGESDLFRPSTLTNDEWDRFHGRTIGGVPFVMSRSAQTQLFDLFEGFDDESFTLDGRRHSVAPHLQTLAGVHEPQFWDSQYTEWQKGGAAPGWDLQSPAQPLRDVLPQVKIPRSRVCVLGAGAGHDAAYLANQGHFVTAVDFSPAAIGHAKTQYPETPNLKYQVADAFDFAKKNPQQFDLVLEHTLFCAIDPARRNDLTRAWRQLMAPSGYFLGIFFTMDKDPYGSPPFSATEWELRERLKSDFNFLYWTRWKNSIPRRAGKELVVYATRK